jgi:hypothetical protein
MNFKPSYQSFSTFRSSFLQVRVACLNQIDVVSNFEKTRNKDEEKTMKIVHDHFVTNKALLQDFVQLVCQQYFNTKKKQGLSFKDFVSIAEQH